MIPEKRRLLSGLGSVPRREGLVQALPGATEVARAIVRAFVSAFQDAAKREKAAALPDKETVKAQAKTHTARVRRTATRAQSRGGQAVPPTTRALLRSLQELVDQFAPPIRPPKRGDPEIKLRSKAKALQGSAIGGQIVIAVQHGAGNTRSAKLLSDFLEATAARNKARGIVEEERKKQQSIPPKGGFAGNAPSTGGQVNPQPAKPEGPKDQKRKQAAIEGWRRKGVVGKGQQ